MALGKQAEIYTLHESMGTKIEVEYLNIYVQPISDYVKKIGDTLLLPHAN
jgi:hypothetical protein